MAKDSNIWEIILARDIGWRIFLSFSGNLKLCLVLTLRGHSWLCASDCFVFISYWSLPHLLWGLSVVLSAQASSCSHVHQWSHPVTRLWAPSGPLVIPKTLHWCIQLLLSVSMWMSDTQPSSTHAKLLLQLPSPSCLLGLSHLKPEQLTATHPSSCSPHPYNLRVTHDSLFSSSLSPHFLWPLPHPPPSHCIHYQQVLLILPSKCIQNPVYSYHLHPRPCPTPRLSLGWRKEHPHCSLCFCSCPTQCVPSIAAKAVPLNTIVKASHLSAPQLSWAKARVVITALETAAFPALLRTPLSYLSVTLSPTRALLAHWLPGSFSIIASLGLCHWGAFLIGCSTLSHIC